MRANSFGPLLLLAAACGTADVDLNASVTTHSAASCEGTCPVVERDLIAGQHIDSGDVHITNDDDNLYIEITTQDGWLITETHIYAGTGPIPVNRKGTPVPGQFPYKNDFSPGVGTYTETIPLADLGASCGQDLKVAVHAVVKRATGAGTESQTAWADGEGFDSPRWSFYNLYGICCEPPPPPPPPPCNHECVPPPLEPDCREPVSYWQDAAVWPVKPRDNSHCYSSATGTITYGEVMEMDPTDNLFVQLSQEFVAARQNEPCLSYDSVIGPAISETNIITDRCTIAPENVDRALELLDLLASYNNETYLGPYYYNNP